MADPLDDIRDLREQVSMLRERVAALEALAGVKKAIAVKDETAVSELRQALEAHGQSSRPA